MSAIELITEARKARVLAKAFELSTKHGYQWITREMVASAADVSTGYVSTLYGSFVELKRQVVREAIRLENLTILQQALADGNPDAKAAPEELKRRAVASLLE